MTLRKLLGLLLIVLLACGLMWLRQQWKIDSCLDKGGRWNYPQAVCEGAKALLRN